MGVHEHIEPIRNAAVKLEDKDWNLLDKELYQYSRLLEGLGNKKYEIVWKLRMKIENQRIERWYD